MCYVELRSHLRCLFYVGFDAYTCKSFRSMLFFEIYLICVFASVYRVPLYLLYFKSYECRGELHLFKMTPPGYRLWNKPRPIQRFEDVPDAFEDEFAKKWNSISQQGFDDTFKRMWNFYLSYCEAGFKAKNIDLIQFSMNKN